MPQQAPPIDARPFLSSSQKRELASIPEPYRRVGAWLILIRDDRSGEWEERNTKCIECTGQRVPCIDRVDPGTKRRRCESCFLGDMKCSPGYELQNPDAEGTPATGSTRTKKRKHEKEDRDTKVRKSVKQAQTSRRSPSTSSAGTMSSESIIDLTADEVRVINRVGEAKPQPAGRETSLIRQHARDAESTFDGSDSAGEESSGSGSESEGDPPQLRMPRQRLSPEERGKQAAPPFNPPQMNRTRSIRAPPQARSAYPPRVGSLNMEESAANTSAGSVLPAPAASSSSSVRLRFYRNDRIKSLLYKARQTMRPRIAVIVDMREGTFSKKKIKPYDFTIAVATPANARTSTWTVTVIDNRKRLGRVLFNASGPGDVAQANNEERELYVKFALEKAFETFSGLITLEALRYPCLKDLAGGSFYAATLAVACVRNLPSLPDRDFVINEDRALVEHSLLLDNVRNPPPSTTFGSASQVVARISRQDGQFRWA
ncbi:hypothetical protein A1Q1_04140 [Trichosporon asahii var. asahii CBS 2479]|uniref:Uncharacterized protein n=1 Tax=Trichosporon asahii var. asahii (strain ATCC 90039 / CBS 2479 / JCM 2466 / KCTC 7840 / NBRC 103889/ NCYC 2677 / UAMH 7654) TaxID=1186058 RepID=J6EWG1_TRIAS|nr:hypothetical protein A1Q1_04140 [Trichosporon asahii var. asahii CBS 2479]EJT47147.1 hypothetical protein A1Q1_04140 [Trichosporon asahii var. asahii CBS 2479]